MDFWRRHIVKLFFTAFVAGGCVEEFEPNTEVQEDTEQLASALVVDGLLTDEEKTQQVTLTRAFSFAAESPNPVSNARVEVIDNEGTSYIFEEAEPGVYQSQLPFAAQEGKEYRLAITTIDGNRYASEPVTTPAQVPIADLRANRITNDLEMDGVGIFLDNTSNSPEPTFFRYEYEETYKIIAPRWDPFRFEVVRYEPCFPDPFVVDIVPWEDERQICFGSASSSRLIQSSSIELNENEIENFQVHFVSSENYIMSHRYSILVTQYSQTQEAFSFYERLGDFSSSDNVFSQIQPGFFEGNVFAQTDVSEKVLGFFEVASVSSKRLYFNYANLFPEEPLPPYPVNCDTFGNPRLIPRDYHCAGPGICDGNCSSPLIVAIIAGLVTYARDKDEDIISPYYTWSSTCGDCTKLGSNVVPEFWEEE